MKIQFACPSCGAVGAVDAAFAGRGARCKHCGGRFTIPSTGNPAGECYALEEPTGERAGVAAMDRDAGSSFVPNRAGDDTITTTAGRRKKQAAKRSTAPSGHRRSADTGWRTWLIRGGVTVVLVLAAIAVVAPRGTAIVGSLLAIV